jgi:hypothetical protein
LYDDGVETEKMRVGHMGRRVDKAGKENEGGGRRGGEEGENVKANFGK